MNQNNLLLHVDSQFASPYAMSVFVALHEKGVPFGTSPVDLGAREHHGAAYASTSLTRRVPTLEFGDFALSESSAITEFLDETFNGTRLYPNEPMHRARARQVQAWLRSDLMPIRRERSTDVIFLGAVKPPLSKEAKSAAGQLFDFAEALLPHGADHLFGEWSIADTDLAVMLARLAMHGDAVPDRLLAYAHKQWRRPSVQRWVLQRRPRS